MDTFSNFIGGAILFVAAIFFAVILGTAFGALAGWVVGIFFSETILGILGQLGIHNITMWQFGAFMGFIGGYMKTKVSSSEFKKSK